MREIMNLLEDSDQTVAMTLYHGTSEDFDEFDIDKLPESGAFGSGFYFSNSYSLGRQYSRGKEPMICRVTLDNPFVYDADGPYEERPRLSPAKTLRQRLMAQGYDGILVKQDSDNGYREVIAYNPDNITILGRGKIKR